MTNHCMLMRAAGQRHPAPVLPHLRRLSTCSCHPSPSAAAAVLCLRLQCPAAEARAGAALGVVCAYHRAAALSRGTPSGPSHDVPPCRSITQRGLHPHELSTSWLTCDGGRTEGRRWLQVTATASLPHGGRAASTHGSIPPLPEVTSSTRVAFATPLRARFPSDFRRDMLRSCLVEQALDCTDRRCGVPMRVQVDAMSDDGGVLPAAIHAAALARINLGHVPREWPGFSAVSLAGAWPSWVCVEMHAPTPT